MNDVRCASLVACELACKDDASCLLACELAAPESVAAARAFGACIAKECASSCVTRRWACLRSPPEEAPATGEPIEITYRFVDYAGEKPLRDLSVRACRANDLYCTAPLTSIAKTDGDGTVRIALEERAFDGYVEVTGALYGPVMLFFPRLTKSFVTGTHPLLSGSELADARNAITSAANSSFDPARGTVLAAVRDCNGDRAAGVSFTVAPLEGAVRFFSVGTGASPSPIATSNDGYSAGGFVNVVANAALTIGGRVEENGLTYPPSVVSVRPKTDGYTMTYLLAAPPR